MLVFSMELGQSVSAELKQRKRLLDVWTEED